MSALNWASEPSWMWALDTQLCNYRKFIHVDNYIPATVVSEWYIEEFV